MATPSDAANRSPAAMQVSLEQSGNYRITRKVLWCFLSLWRKSAVL